MAHACNPSTLGGQGGWLTWGQEFETSLTNMMKLRLYYKYKKLAGVVVTGACYPSYSGGWGRRIAWTWEAEVAVSRDRSSALQPGQQVQNSISNRKRRHQSIYVHMCGIHWFGPEGCDNLKGRGCLQFIGGFNNFLVGNWLKVKLLS